MSGVSLPGAENDDLSPYERARLRNIAANNRYLEQLGLTQRVQERANRARKAAAAVEAKRAQRREAADVKRREARKRRASNAKAAPLRRSARCRGQKPDYTGERIVDQAPSKRGRSSRKASKRRRIGEVAGSDAAATDNEGSDGDESDAPTVDYGMLPREPDELDDLEFTVYTRLRSWRLRRKRELDIEPYKIFQNRTLCEVVRRRRNASGWARVDRTTHAISKSASDDGASGEDGENDAHARLSRELLQAWGVGPSKVGGCKHSEVGFAHEMLIVLDAPENDEKLRESVLVEKATKAEAESAARGEDKEN
jgi:superfamily II DNA helicase RecQ